MSRAFLITPFTPERAGNEAAAVFPAVQDAIRMAASDAGIELVHPARINRAGVVMDHVEDELARADLVVAILTGSNPNVFFELGGPSFRRSCWLTLPIGSRLTSGTIGL